MIDKQNIIEDLGSKDFLKFLKMLFISMGFQQIKIIDNVIIAIENSKLKSILHAFYVNTTLLSGKVNIEEVTTRVKDIQKKIHPDILTITANHHISKGFQNSLNGRVNNLPLQYLGRDELIPLFDKYIVEIWSHNDPKLLDYERKFKGRIAEDNQLRILHLPQAKFEKLLNIFVNPSLEKIEEDPKTRTFIRKRMGLDDIIQNPKCSIISGISGSGKTTILKNIGLQLIQSNSSSELKGKKKNLPIFIASMDILEAKLNIEHAVEKQLEEDFRDMDLQEIAKSYNIIVLVDSIDEFEQSEKERIIRKLTNNATNKGIKFYLATRDADTSKDYINSPNVQFVTLSKFNLEQIRRFVYAFLPDQDKANDLLESLRENKILERLPITPLTLSLISILYDENDYEVPATITDIYKNFNDLIVGRSIVSEKIGFVDVSFKERILSIYGYMLMKQENHQPLTNNEFIKYFSEFYKGKSLPIKNSKLIDVLNYLIDNTGILYLKDHKWVCFSHDSYMEYYAAIEIFNNHRDEESLLIDNFFDVMWQNVAVFYAGITKDMNGFAAKVNEKLKQAHKIFEFISGVQGAGYLLQALYQTNNSTRKDVILTALNMVLEITESFKKMSAYNNTIFQNYKIPILLLLNFLHFYEMFNSLTLKMPLQLAFDELVSEYNNIISGKVDVSRLPSLGFKLIELAFTLDSKRIGEDNGIKIIYNFNELYKDPNLNALMELSIDFLGKDKYKELRRKVKKESTLIIPLLKNIASDSTGKIRFSLMDTINPDRKVTLYVEGKTDATILEHAFMVITDGNTPYWNVKMATTNGSTGSANAVSKAIESAINFTSTDSIYIGLFDHDAAGLSEYRKLSKNYIESVEEKDCFKQRKGYNIYILCIPVPGEMKQYLNSKQEFNFFELEHYFGHDFLRNHDMISEKETLSGVYEVRDRKKATFAQEISKIDNPEVFKYFKDLFIKIDKICGYEGKIDYII
ncbi:MAG: hypothetical protein LKH27_10280 [Prevotella sp.]|jgi:ABC-type ATPase involved in cell division|nr:hypothetical protein [Prevotella sp.]MCH3993428.1 hypothetical protein [Prevotella sp.]MCI1474781.1 hypothetical protein [Prevotella sp.]